jgi:hypothetical protein
MLGRCSKARTILGGIRAARSATIVDDALAWHRDPISASVHAHRTGTD